MRPNLRHGLAVVFGGLFSVCAMDTLSAQTYVFTGNSGVDDNWSTAANWSGGVAPNPTDTTDDIVLSGTATVSNIDAAYSGFTINSLTQSPGAAYTLTGT